MADRGDPTELFGVEMDQFAGPLALIAHHWWLGVERGEDRPTVDTGMISSRAIAGPLRRCRRSSVISAIRSAPMRCW